MRRIAIAYIFDISACAHQLEADFRMGGLPSTMLDLFPNPV